MTSVVDAMRPLESVHESPGAYISAIPPGVPRPAFVQRLLFRPVEARALLNWRPGVTMPPDRAVVRGIVWLVRTTERAT